MFLPQASEEAIPEGAEVAAEVRARRTVAESTQNHTAVPTAQVGARRTRAVTTQDPQELAVTGGTNNRIEALLMNWLTLEEKWFEGKTMASWLNLIRNHILCGVLVFASVPAAMLAQVGVDNSVGDSTLRAYEASRRIELEERKVEYDHQFQQKKIALMEQDLRLKEREAALDQKANSSFTQFPKEELSASVKRLQVIYPDLKQYLPDMGKLATKFRPVPSPEFGPDGYVEGLYKIAKFNGRGTKPCGESGQSFTQ